MGTPLELVVAAVTENASSSLTDIEPLAALSYRRCGKEGKAYVTPDGAEAWEGKSSDELITDLREELADAYAYCSALIYRNYNVSLVNVLLALGQADEHLRSVKDVRAA